MTKQLWLSFLCPVLGCEAMLAHAAGWVYAFPTCSSFYDWISRINGAGRGKPYCGSTSDRKTGPYSNFNVYIVKKKKIYESMGYEKEKSKIGLAFCFFFLRFLFIYLIERASTSRQSSRQR